MDIARYFSTLTRNAVSMHHSQIVNCTLAGLMVLSAMMLVSTAAVIFELHWASGLRDVPVRFVYIMAFFQLVPLVCIYFFDKKKWTERKPVERLAWLTWLGISMAMSGAILMCINIDSFTVSLFVQGMLFGLIGLRCYHNRKV